MAPSKLKSREPWEAVEAVVDVRHVEDLKDRLQRDAAAEGERAREADVPGQEVVLAP